MLDVVKERHGGVSDDDPGTRDFRAAVLAGLNQACKAIPCRFLYDTAGSVLFERICETPEYYLTRAETGILRQHARDIAHHIGPDAVLIELGSGSSRKVRILLDALERPRAYVPIDISGEHLRASAAALARSYPALRVAALCADYNHALTLPEFSHSGRRVAFFPGSTIGNLTQTEAVRLLSAWSRQLGANSAMLVGVDLKKSPHGLNAAYNDASGVTASFIKNVLARANRELGADFALDRFTLDARYVAERSRVELHLRSLAPQRVHIAGRAFEFAAGEQLLIEYSYKYTVEEFQALVRVAGFQPQAAWVDAGQKFSVHYLVGCPAEKP